jgi:hypothetical protein
MVSVEVLLNCILMARACYRAALPTFHHWRVEQMKYGLSFGSSYDAAKFHNRLQKALEHLARQSKSSMFIELFEFIYIFITGRALFCANFIVLFMNVMEDW